jgi:hypothetical protein
VSVFADLLDIDSEGIEVIQFKEQHLVQHLWTDKFKSTYYSNLDISADCIITRAVHHTPIFF